MRAEACNLPKFKEEDLAADLLVMVAMKRVPLPVAKMIQLVKMRLLFLCRDVAEVEDLILLQNRDNAPGISG